MTDEASGVDAPDLPPGLAERIATAAAARGHDGTAAFVADAVRDALDGAAPLSEAAVDAVAESRSQRASGDVESAEAARDTVGVEPAAATLVDEDRHGDRADVAYTARAADQLWHTNSHIAAQVMAAVDAAAAGERPLERVVGWPLHEVRMGDYRALATVEGSPTRDDVDGGPPPDRIVVDAAGHRLDLFERERADEVPP